MKTYSSVQGKFNMNQETEHKLHRNLSEAWDLPVVEVHPSQLLCPALTLLTSQPGCTAKKASLSNTHAHTLSCPASNAAFWQLPVDQEEQGSLVRDGVSPGVLWAIPVRLWHYQETQPFEVWWSAVDADRAKNCGSLGLILKSCIFKFHQGLRLRNVWKSPAEVMFKSGQVSA